MVSRHVRGAWGGAGCQRFRARRVGQTPGLFAGALLPCALRVSAGTGDDGPPGTPGDGGLPRADASPVPDAPAPGAPGPDASLLDGPTPDAPASADAGPDAGAQRPPVSINPLGNLPGAVHGMAVDDSGRLFFSDSFNSSIARQAYYVDPPYTGTPTSTGITAGLPAGLLWETDTLFVCDTQNGQVRQYDDTFTLVDQWTATLCPGQLARTPVRRGQSRAGRPMGELPSRWKDDRSVVRRRYTR